MEENKYRYNDISERLRRMNRIYMGATIFMAALILLYLWMKQMNHNIKTVTVYGNTVVLLAFTVVNAVIYCRNKATSKLKVAVTMEMGIDYSDIIDNSFYKKSYIQNQILGRALLESVLFYDGRCIFSSVSIEEMNFYGVTGKELGGIIEQLRLTDGVEVAIFLYETDKDEYKVSLRSKKMIDVARIATAFGGGGHVRAAGFSAKGNVHSIVNKIGEMIEQQYNEDNA